MAYQEILTALAIGDRAKNTFQSNRAMERELEAGGTDVPWWKKALALPFGMLGQEGLNIHLSGQVDRQRTADATALRQTESAGITAAAMKEMAAAEAGIRRQVGTGVQAVRNRFGQAGTFQSGARGRAEDRVRQEGTQVLSEAFAGIELESIRAHQAGAANALALNMQQAQMQWQKQREESAMIASLIEIGLPFLLDGKTKETIPSLNPMQALYTRERNMQYNTSFGDDGLGGGMDDEFSRRMFLAERNRQYNSAYGGGF